MASQSALEKTLWDNFHMMKKLSEDHGVELALPRILMAGSQSAGKTMAVSTLVGFPVGFSQSGIGNKCVTEYSIVNDMSCPEPRMTIKFPAIGASDAGGGSAPIECGLKELHHHMAKFMKGLPTVTADVIHVTIRSANQQDLVVVDPPGLILTPSSDPAEKETQECIRQVMIHHMGRPNTFTYFLASCPSDFQAFAYLRIFYDLIREADPTWRLDDTNRFGIIVNKVDQRTTDIVNSIENEKFDTVMADPEYTFYYVTLNPRGTNIESSQVDQVALFRNHPKTEAEWIAENIQRPLGRTSQEFQNKFRKNFMSNFSMLAVRGDMKEKMLSVFKSSLNDVRAKIKSVRNDAKERREILLAKQESMSGDTHDVEHSARIFVEHMLAILHFMDVRIPTATGASECFTYRSELEIDGTKIGKSMADLVNMSRTIPGVVLSEQELRDSLMKEAPYGDQYTLLTLDDRMTGFYAIDNLKKLFEYNLLARNITVYSRTDIAAMGAGVHHRENFNPMNVVRRVVAEQITNNTAAVHWFFETVDRLLDHMSEMVLKRISLLPTTTETQNTVMRLIREAFLEYVRKDLMQRITRLWGDLLEINRDYVPTDIWTKTVMLLIQCPMVRIIADQKHIEEAFEEQRAEIRASRAGPSSAEGIMTRVDGKTWEESAGERDIEAKSQKRYMSKAEHLQRIYQTFQQARQQQIFSTADTVEGGMQMPKPADEQAFEAKYVNELCLFYYRQVQTQLIHDFDKAYNKFLKEPLSPAEIRAPNELVLRVTKVLEESPEIEDLVETMQREKESIDEQLLETNQEIKDLQHVLNSTTGTPSG
mmetsp:Transcript_27343/g.79736  ORF Transcript_27343/g.79736 Transcript_27343/m.79736 type:complete len:820 (-) Transcript_27343:506-2965(-)